MAASGSGGVESGSGAFADQFSFHLGEAGEDVEHEPAAGGGGVDVLGQAAEADLAGVEVGDEVDEVAYGAAEAVEAPHHEGVTGAELVEEPVEFGSAVELA